MAIWLYYQEMWAKKKKNNSLLRMYPSGIPEKLWANYSYGLMSQKWSYMVTLTLIIHCDGMQMLIITSFLIMSDSNSDINGNGPSNDHDHRSKPLELNW